jgi:hypothetical protein
MTQKLINDSDVDLSFITEKKDKAEPKTKRNTAKKNIQAKLQTQVFNDVI